MAFGESAIFLAKGRRMYSDDRRSVTWLAVAAMALFLSTGCDDDGETESGAGGSAMGGTPAMGGGTGMGGEPATGGAPTMGGAPAMGGDPAPGGTPAMGGEPAPGGTPAMGGAPAAGGAPAMGGAPAVGGEMGMGGASAASDVYLEATPDCPQRAGFFDLANADNFIDYNEDGQTNADVFDNADLAPSIDVSCANGTVSVTSNGVVNYDYYAVSPDGVGGDINSEQMRAPEVNNTTYTFPMAPEMAAEVTPLPLAGAAGVLSNGIQLFGPNEATRDNGADPYLHGLLGYCGGHVNVYHHHSFPFCFFDYPTIGGAPRLLDSGVPGTVVGYSFDGYPIMAPYECADADCATVLEVKSSWDYDTTAMWAIDDQNLSGDCLTDDAGGYSDNYVWDCNVFNGQKADTAEALYADQCNGRVRNDGSYVYYATKAFPYFMGCYRGTPSATVGGGSAPGMGMMGMGPPPG